LRLIASLQPHESDPAALAHDLLLISRVLPQHLDGPGRADRPKRLRRLMAHLMTGNQRQSSEAIRGQKKLFEAIRCNQMQSDAIRCNRRQSDAIVGNQRQSEAIRGNQKRTMDHAVLVLAAHSVTERVDRPRVLELPEDERDLVLEQRALLLVAEGRRDETHNGNQRQSEAIRGNQRLALTERLSGNQHQSAVMRVHQRQLHAIRGNQRQSEAISEAISMPSGFVTLGEARHSQRGSSAPSPALGTASRSAKSALYLTRGGIRCHQHAIRRRQLAPADRCA
jgi:hypothetical protein